MKLTLLCNAGLAVETEDAMLLVDVPNQEIAGFYRLPDELWQKILDHVPPFDKVCGFWFTHDHPDHFDRIRMEQYLARWPGTKVFLPDVLTQGGRARIGPFVMEYKRIDHAPIAGAPPHVVCRIEAGEKSVYISGDAALDEQAHRAFLRGRKSDAAVWNSMYLSRPDTRALLKDAADRNFICHMPQARPDGMGLWRKLEVNFTRYAEELHTVTVWEQYPSQAEI